MVIFQNLNSFFKSIKPDLFSIPPLSRKAERGDRFVRHYNLYYLFLEDQQKHPIPEDKCLQIRNNLENFYKKIKPPWKSQPPSIIREENLD